MTVNSYPSSEQLGRPQMRLMLMMITICRRSHVMRSWWSRLKFDATIMCTQWQKQQKNAWRRPRLENQTHIHNSEKKLWMKGSSLGIGLPAWLGVEWHILRGYRRRHHHHHHISGNPRDIDWIKRIGDGLNFLCSFSWFMNSEWLGIVLGWL